MVRHILCRSVVFNHEPFAAIVAERVNELVLARPAREDLSVTVLDVGNGTRKSIDIRVKQGKVTRTEVSEKVCDPVTDNSYETVDATDSHGQPVRQRRFRRNQRKIMSIVDLYNQVIAIGQDDPGTIGEISIFSHAIYKGPVLVNSYDENSERAQRDPAFMSGNLRDPNDKDGRMKDFLDVNMSSERRALFKSAFRPNGFVWVWGCNANKVLHTLLRKIDTSGGGAPTTDKIELKQLTAQQISALSDVATIFGIDVARMRKTQRCVIAGTDLKLLLLALVQECYAYELATRLGIKVYAALPGTGAFWPDGKTMRIESHHRPNAKMFASWLGMKLDPLDRAYGEFVP